MESCLKALSVDVAVLVDLKLTFENQGIGFSCSLISLLSQD